MINAALINWATTALQNKKSQSNRHYPQLSQLTIVIPSFCRQEYLLRQLVYWAFSDATIITADGSPVPLDTQLIQLISNVPNVHYLHLLDSYTKRIQACCKLIKTPYSMCLADDDMFLMDGLSLAVDYLNQNSKIDVCMGQVVGINYDQSKREAHIIPYGDSLENYQVIHSDPLRRIRLGIDAYRTATSYAVFRTPTFENVWHGLQTTSCLEATEYEHAISTYTLGNLSTVSNVYWLRSFECDPVDSVIDGTRKTDFIAWWTRKEYKLEREAFADRLSVQLSNSTSLSEEKAREEILLVIDWILEGRHIGLMNQTQSMAILFSIMKIIKSIPSLHRYFMKFRSTKLGGLIKNTIMTSIRGVVTNPEFTVKMGMTDAASAELKELLLFVSRFHAALTSN